MASSSALLSSNNNSNNNSHSKISQQPQLRVLTLQKDDHRLSILYRLQKGWVVHFVLGTDLYHEHVKLCVNHPSAEQDNDITDEDGFRQLPWKADRSLTDESDCYAELIIVKSGTYKYYFTCGEKGEPQGSGHFVIDPSLHIGPDSEELPLECITLQTVLTKCLGTFDGWPDRLRVSKESGYNAVHFTPLQQLGQSNSAYCLRDHFTVDKRFSSSPSQPVSWEDVAELTKMLNIDWSMISITDVVWNHIACDSEFLQKHPESTYNLTNSTHLRPAYIFDRILWYFSKEVSEGKWAYRNVPPNVTSEDHLMALKAALLDEVLPHYHIEEFFMLDVDTITDQFHEACLVADEPDNVDVVVDDEKINIIQDPLYRRNTSTIDMQLALKKYNRHKRGSTCDVQRITACVEQLRVELMLLNLMKKNEINSCLLNGVNNVISHVRYHRLDSNGPKQGPFSAENPIVYMYFTYFDTPVDVETDEQLIHTERGQYNMAHNGWVMNYDPMKNFAEKGSDVYLKRELIVWGDSVKCHFGDSYESCPVLWDHMTNYTELMAKHFHGVRLDNCHNTPLHAAEHFLKAARIVNPNLFVVAELFTGSEHIDNMFVNRLGINSLIREAMSAGNSHEEGRLVYKYGGKPVGAFHQHMANPLEPSIAHALFMDQTHDNQCPIEIRSVYDPLPSAAIVSMACCATGSNRGYDELVPHHIHVVNEDRMYSSWSDSESGPGQCNNQTGIIAAKRALNNLHISLGAAGFDQVFVDQVDEHIVAVTRHSPISHQTVILVARTSFQHPSNANYTGYIPPLCVPGVVEEIILEARLVPNNGTAGNSASFNKDSQYLNGMMGYKLDMREHIQLYGSMMVDLSDDSDHVHEIDFINFPPGSIIALRVSISPQCRSAISALRSSLSKFGYRLRSNSGGRSPTRKKSQDFYTIATRLSLSDINRVLFRSDSEERDDGKGIGVYHIPGYGDLPYCGLQGFMSVLETLRVTDDLGHPLCENIRAGNWMMIYITTRLKMHKSTSDLGKWFEGVFELFEDIPRFLIPSYFDAMLVGAYKTLIDVAISQMSDFVKQGTTFTKKLAMNSVQLCGVVKSAPLPRLSPAIKDVPTTVNEDTGQRDQCNTTIAAGLPHFSVGVMRNWGRDTFISLRGLMLVTGRYTEARNIILAYAGCLRHGLIPNLLGAGECARYNCRDATWWWLQAIQDYCTMVPDGYDILGMSTSRMYPHDEAEAQPAGIEDRPLHCVMQESLTRHYEGICFKERMAGSHIDAHMIDRGTHLMQGFVVQIHVDSGTGFVTGGNEWNCGTWMDKMGESDRAGNRGKPATPRDGAAVEIVGLCKSTVRWLTRIYSECIYPYQGVSRIEDGQKVELSWKSWDDLLSRQFERYFYVPEKLNPVLFNVALVNKHHIYRDTVGATQAWGDYQLRPNFLIAMALAPEMFTVDHAWKALCIVEEKLLGPLGLRTLDPDDWNYNGYYDMNDDGTNPSTAKGNNYHQGPEWLWVFGYYLRAKLNIAKLRDNEHPCTLSSTLEYIKLLLTRHRVALDNSTWKGLHELTNKNGSPCHHGCPIQAWSSATILDVLYDINKLSCQ